MSFAAFVSGVMQPTIDRYKAEQLTKRRLEEHAAQSKLDKALSEWEYYTPQEREAVAPELDKILKQKKGYSADLLGKGEQGYKFLKGALDQQRPIQELEAGAKQVAARPINLGGQIAGPETLDAVNPGEFEKSATPIQLPSRPVSLPPLPIEGANIPRVDSNVLQMPASQRALAVQDYKKRQAGMLERQSKVGEIQQSPLDPEDQEVAIESLYLPPGVLSARERAALRATGSGNIGLGTIELISPDGKQTLNVQATRGGGYINAATGRVIDPASVAGWTKRHFVAPQVFPNQEGSIDVLNKELMGQKMSQGGTLAGQVPDIRPAGPPSQLQTITDENGPRVVEYNPTRGAGAGNVRTVASGAVKGTVPPLPEGTQRELTGLGTGAQSLGELQTLLPKISTGPIWGRLRNVELRYLGGFGTTPEEVAAATQINMLMRSAFDVAGANFTEPEMRIFRTIYPQQTDTLQTALTKIPQSLQYIQNRMKARQGLMTPMQRSQTQFPNVGTGGRAPQNQQAAPPPTGDAGAVRVRRKADGKTGKMSRAAYEANKEKYDLVQ